MSEDSETSSLGTWRQRSNKTYQDKQASQNRDRVRAAQKRLEWMEKHKPANSRDWDAYRGE